MDTQTLKGHLEDRARARHRGDAEADDFLVRDHPLLPARKARKQPVASGAATLGATPEDGDADRHDASSARFFGREDNLDVQSFELFGLRDSDVGEVAANPVVNRLERRTNALGRAKTRNNRAPDRRHRRGAYRHDVSALGAPDRVVVRSPALRVGQDVVGLADFLKGVRRLLARDVGAALMSIEILLGRLADRAPDALPRLEVARRQLLRTNDLVASILDAAYLEEGRIELKPTRVEIVPFVNNMLRDWREAHPNASVVADFVAAPVVVRIDPPRIRQILDNLFINAIKYAGADKPIVVSLEHRPETVAIRLRDHGPGIPREQLRHVFDRFFRADDTPGRGHGLGLYIAAALARLHAGTLEADAADGGGTVFSLTLPTATAPTDA